MAILQVTLPESLKAFVDTKAAAGGFPSPGDYLTALLTAIQKREAWDQLEPLVLQGLASPARAITPEDWHALHGEIDRIEAQQTAS